MSMEGRWQEMPELIIDEMLEEFAIIGTHEEIVPKLKERWAGLFSSIGFPSDFPSRRQLQEAIHVLRQV
jgi:hypothetical protein